MSYVENNLGPNERVVYLSRLTPLFWWNAAIWLILLGWLWGLGVLIALIIIIRQMTTEIAVTDRRFVYKTGWLFQKSHDIQLTKVESTVIKQGPFGRMFNYGTLEIRGTGLGSIKIASVDDPRALKAVVEEQAASPRQQVQRSVSAAVGAA